jgi:hypothetical protein
MDFLNYFLVELIKMCICRRFADSGLVTGMWEKIAHTKMRNLLKLVRKLFKVDYDIFCLSKGRVFMCSWIHSQKSPLQSTQPGEKDSRS